MLLSSLFISKSIDLILVVLIIFSLLLNKSLTLLLQIILILLESLSVYFSQSLFALLLLNYSIMELPLYLQELLLLFAKSCFLLSFSLKELTAQFSHCGLQNLNFLQSRPKLLIFLSQSHLILSLKLRNSLLAFFSESLALQALPFTDLNEVSLSSLELIFQ